MRGGIKDKGTMLHNSNLEYEARLVYGTYIRHIEEAWLDGLLIMAFATALSMFCTFLP